LYSKEEGTKLKRKTNHQKGREKEKHTRMGQRSSIIIRKCIGLVGTWLPFANNGVHCLVESMACAFWGAFKKKESHIFKKIRRN
jgi:hypothetical protein